MEKNWYERWFDEEYKALYQNRDQAQAERQTRAVVQACDAQSAWSILDVGCGGGRHLRGFRSLGLRAFGVDLSRVLLRDASPAAVAQADMRHLPFADAAFDLLTSFFTSFGYFVTFAEDVAVLREFRRALRHGGFLFLDLPNPDYVKSHLVSKDEQVIAGRRVVQERFLDGDRVVKRIRITAPPDGERHGERHTEVPEDVHEDVHEERVRLFTLDRLRPVLDELGFSLMRLFGDEGGDAFDPVASPRMSLLLRCWP